MTGMGDANATTNLVAPDLIRGPAASCATLEQAAGPRIKSGVTNGWERPLGLMCKLQDRLPIKTGRM